MANFSLLPAELEDVPSSQELNEEELNAMVEESKPGSTKKSTSWGWTKFEKWMNTLKCLLIGGGQNKRGDAENFLVLIIGGVPK